MFMWVAIKTTRKENLISVPTPMVTEQTHAAVHVLDSIFSLCNMMAGVVVASTELVTHRIVRFLKAIVVPVGLVVLGQILCFSKVAALPFVIMAMHVRSCR